MAKPSSRGMLVWLGLEQLSAQLWFLPAGLRLALTDHPTRP